MQFDRPFGMAAPCVPPLDAFLPLRISGDPPLDVGLEIERKVGRGYELAYSNGATAAY